MSLLLSNDKVSYLTVVNKTASSDDILEVRNMHVISVSDKEDQRQNYEKPSQKFVNISSDKKSLLLMQQ